MRSFTTTDCKMAATHRVLESKSEVRVGGNHRPRNRIVVKHPVPEVMHRDAQTPHNDGAVAPASAGKNRWRAKCSHKDISAPKPAADHQPRC
jgi:hypothetical protein